MKQVILLITGFLCIGLHSCGSSDGENEEVDLDLMSDESVENYLTGTWCRSTITGDEQYIISSGGSINYKTKDPRADTYQKGLGGPYSYSQVKRSKYRDTKESYCYISYDKDLNGTPNSFFVIRKDGKLYNVPYDEGSEDEYGLLMDEWKVNTPVSYRPVYYKCN